MNQYQSIKEDIQRIVNDLLKASRQMCCNNISNNILYIKRFISEKDQQSSFSEISEKRYKEFTQKNLLNIDELTTEVETSQSMILWIDLILYFSSDKETIILAECISGKGNSGLSFHASIIAPPENIQNNSKFDLNWYYNSIKLENKID